MIQKILPTQTSLRFQDKKKASESISCSWAFVWWWWKRYLTYLRIIDTFLRYSSRTLGVFVTVLQIFNECFQVGSTAQLKSRLPRRFSPSRSSPKIPDSIQCWQQGWGAGRELHRGGIEQPQMGWTHKLNMQGWRGCCRPHNGIIHAALALFSSGHSWYFPRNPPQWGNGACGETFPRWETAGERNSCKWPQTKAQATFFFIPLRAFCGPVLLSSWHPILLQFKRVFTRMYKQQPVPENSHWRRKNQENFPSTQSLCLRWGKTVGQRKKKAQKYKL